MDRQELEIIAGKNQEESDVVQNNLAAGRAKDFEDYKYQVGIIFGFAKANSILQGLAQAQLEDDDDE